MFWRIIAQNRRKTAALIILMGLLLLAIGYLLGFYLGASTEAGLVGLGVTAIVWLSMLLVALFASDNIFLHMSGAREVERDEFPQLFNIVEEMKIAASLEAIPRIFIMDDPAPNAFAVGKSPEKSAICVTAGLLGCCNRDELQGVIAHELGHIMNRDILYMTVAATMLGAIVFIADMISNSMRFGSHRRYRSSSSRNDSNDGGALLILIALLIAIIGPLLARILYFSVSRKREYLADATSARLTRYPAGLASALEKLKGASYRLTSAPRATAPFYIVNPYKSQLSDNVFATHPPLDRRIEILRKMHGSAGYSEYLRAHRSVTGTKKPLLKQQDLSGSQQIDIRAASAIAAPMMAGEMMRKTGDIMRGINNFSLIECSCGMRIKLPPEFEEDKVTCPKCGLEHCVRQQDKEQLSNLLGAAALHEKPGAGPQNFRRNPGQWQSFTCQSCGHQQEISPAFKLSQLDCPKCGQKISIN